MINTDAKLATVLENLRTTPWIAVDTEADSLHAYPEKVCLIQISSPAGDDLIDPLAKIDLTPLFKLFADHELIMHGADYDLRLLRKHHDFVPRAIFDTMLASRLLGVTQFGLIHLVSHYLEVTLDKGSQKADWARRPLTEKMEQYARNDTHYLKPLADKLAAELKARGRLEWHQEMCARLIEDCSVRTPVDTDRVWRVKGSNRLTRQALAVLREIWTWREEEAIAANRPPFFILQHEALVELAAAAAAGRPVDPLVPRRFPERRRANLAHAIQRGLEVPAAQRPEPIKQVFRRLSDTTKRRAAELQKRRDDRAKELGIDPTLIASRAVLLDLADNLPEQEKALMSWQRELLK